MKLERKFEFNAKDIIFSSSTSNIYKINGFVGKALKNNIYSGNSNSIKNLRRNNYPIICLNHEFKIAKELFENNISVPEPLGVFDVKCNDNNKFYPIFIMEYWDNGKGVYIDSIQDFIIKKRARLMLEQEVRTAEELGFSCEDAFFLENSLYSFDKDKICLLDFEYWSKKD